MCGISGYININNEPIRDTSTILDMLRVQKHRGPDDSGIRAFSLRDGNSMEMPINEPVLSLEVSKECLDLTGLVSWIFHQTVINLW